LPPMEIAPLPFKRVKEPGTHSVRPRDRDEVFRLREQGWTLRRIAKEFGVATSTIHYILASRRRAA
jgi:IS30 family transposase